MKLILDFESIRGAKLKVTKISIGLCMGLVISGCVGTKYLEKDQKLLDKQSIKVPKGFDKEGLNDDFYVQKANRRFLGLPINTLTWMYYLGLRRFNKETSWFIQSKNDFVRKKEKKEKKFDRKIAATDNDQKKINLQFRKQQKIEALNFKIENGNLPMQWGEKVSVYDSANVTATVDKINIYLFNEGYFLGSTKPEIIEKKRKVKVKYIVTPGQPFLYDTIFYRIADTAVMQLVRRYEPLSKLKIGDRYEQKKISEERDRIDLMLKDHGYYDFSKQYIDFQIDTAFRRRNAIALQMAISDPVNHAHHKVFRIDSVNFTTDASVKNKSGVKRTSTYYHDIKYNYFLDQYNKKILTNRVFIHRDSLYSRTNTFSTQRQLANLDIFKFVNINYDTSGGKFIANIFTSPLDRYSWTNEAGVTVTQGFPGPYYSLSFKKRNIFHGLEIFELNGRFGFEGVASATEIGNVYKSTEANINTSVTFPQFLFPLGKAAEGFGKYNPKTRLLAGYTYTDRPEYQRSNVTISGTYTWESKNRTRQYSLTLVNLQIIQSTTDSAFNATLLNLQATQGNNLINSFKPSLVSSTIFAMTWNPNNYGNNDRSSYFMQVKAESGGTLFNFYTPTYATDRGLQTYKYLRLGLDYRRKKIIDRNTSVAFRLNTGVSYSYGGNNALPYEKYFFIGGSNSVRAWRPRRLGIGSFPPNLSTDPISNGLFDYRYEKPGEILLEGSIEWRKHLFGFVNGAIFIDAGNVWSFQQATTPATSETTASWSSQGNTKFYFDKFYNEIAVGTGFGLRFDFNFLVLRVDVGMKAWDPSRPEGERFVLDRISFSQPYAVRNADGSYSNYKEPVIWNVGIGYPF
ncbi:MAG: BamA/TamA family outer membrane protein [Cyclobacteriaceae bacterium]|nr:BamA/TamA family outer membrane protein [Cyclobacteriaceae bacterium]